MRWVIALAGGLWIVIIAWDTFEAVVLPRRATRRFRTTRLFFRTTWWAWSAVARRIRPGGRREACLSYYGPLSLLLLFAVWAASFIAAFAMVQFGLGTRLSVEGGGTFAQHIYMSGETFFTLGLGDITPVSPLGRALMVVEAGMGFGFLALVIGYVPILYQSFSRREVEITRLDARAGSPPSAEELLRGHGDDLGQLAELLREWERWSADVLESHLSYPVLSYYRSQHDNQSWLAALTTVLDASALVSIGVEGACQRQARLTFAMARHTVADIAQVLGRPPIADVDRLPGDELARLRASLSAAGVTLNTGAGADDKLAELRTMYEPYVAALSRHLLMPLPPWRTGGRARENWRITAWGQTSASPEDLHPEDRD